MYNRNVMQHAWRDYKIKKKHKGYETWTFKQSLYWAHKFVKKLNETIIY
jgi:hypothetical protein